MSFRIALVDLQGNQLDFLQVLQEIQGHILLDQVSIGTDLIKN